MEQHQADKKIISELIERQKELSCLYKVNEHLLDLVSPIEEVMKRVCNSIEKSMQYSNISQCELYVNNQCYALNPVKRTELKLSAKAIFEETTILINVYYIKPVRKEHRTIFLPEEQQLINTIAQKVAQYISYRRLKEAYESSINPKSTTIFDDEHLFQWLRGLSLSEKEIQKLLMNEVYFKKGETISKQSTISNYLMLLKEGRVKLLLEHFFDHQFIFKILKPFDFIGLSCLYEDHTYPFTAISLVPVKVYLIEKRVVRDIIYTNPAFAEKILTMYTRNFSFLLQRMNSISNKQALGRLSDSLLYLSDKVFESPVIESYISRRDLADLCGLSTENTVRMLSDLKNNQIIAINRNEIHILNRDKLISLSQHG